MIVLLVVITNRSLAQWNLTGNANATNTSILGTTNAIPLNLTTNNVSRLVIDANGKIGIGTSTPINLLTVKGAGSTPAASWVAAGAPLFVGFGENTVGNADYILSMASTLSNARPVFIGRRSKGTLAAPLSLSNNDFIMSFLSSAYDGAAFQNPAAIDFFVDGTPTTGSVPARISFVTGSNSTNRAERLKIGNTGDITINNNQLFVQKSTGNVGVGNILPQAKMDITGNIKIADGTQGAGKVLTSDANGLATWATAGTGSLPTGSANQTLRYNGTTLQASSTIINTGSAVGIGEANPQGILHVSQPSAFTGVSFTGSGVNDLTANNGGYTGTGTSSYVIRISNSGPTPNIIEVSNDGGATFAAPAAIVNPIVLANGVTATFAATGGHTFGDQWSWSVGQAFSNVLVAKDGKVGIGTPTPSTTLDLNGTLKISGGSPGAGKVLVSDATGIGSWNTLSTLETDPQVSVSDTSAVPRWNGAALVTGTITDNGTNVGIGTTSPAATLDVNGTIKISGGSPGAGKVLVSDATGIGSWNTLSILETDPQVSVADTSAVPRWNGAALVTGTITDNGTKVGIGTVTPTALLDVNGDARINGLRIGKGNSNVSNNIVVGSDSALFNNFSGNSNIAIGKGAMKANTSGSSNVAIGNLALYKNTTIGNLVAIGDSALFNNKTNFAQPEFGIFNTAIGAKTLFSNTDGGLNVAVGSYALYKNTTGGYNTATGAGALYLNTTGINNTANGAEALTLNNIGGNNTASGYHAQRYNKTGSNNTATGAEALKYNYYGDSNTANGSGALFSNQGSNNTANGSGALYSNTTGYSNVAVGVVALYKNVKSHNTIAIGDSSLFNHNGTGNYNTAVGSKSLYNSTNSGGNTAIGFYTLHSTTTGNYNTALGYGANSAITTESNSTGIGYDAEPGATNSIAVGNTSITSIKGQVGFTTFSDQRFKKNIKEGEVKGLEFINLLRPVTYNTDINAYAKWKEANYGEKDTANWEGKYDVEKIRFSGFLAQEVEATANKIGYDFSGVDKPKNSKDIYGLRYAEFVVPLVKAVQELSIKNEELKMNNEQQQKINEQLKKDMADLKAMMQQLMNSKTIAPCPPLAGE